MTAPASPAVELREITKHFGAVAANSGVSVQVRPGSIHGIIGENGAGKSTAMNILYGMFQPDAGEILIHGERKKWRSPADAIASGLGMVHQHFMLAGPYSALDNILLGAEPRRFGTIDRSSALKTLRALAEQYGFAMDLEQPVEQLPVGIQQRVEILKLLYRNARILILDEPTAVLTPQETDELFRNLKRLRDEGRTILLITHKLREVMAFTDRVSVFRAGRVVGERETSQTNPQELAELMVGRRVALRVEAEPAKPEAENALEVRGVCRWGKHSPGGGTGPTAGAGRHRLSNVSFTVKKGEIVGIAGVEGNGQSELLQALLHPREPGCRSAGQIEVLGRDVTTWPARRIRELGVAVIPEDRHEEGLLLDEPLAENFLLGLQKERRFSRAGILSVKLIEGSARQAFGEYDVRPPELQLAARNLSGGNQQKLVIAREFQRNPRLLIAAQPTRGVDVGAIEFIHRRILRARDEGAGVLLISSELDEIIALSDRILVMYAGSVVGEFARGKVNETELGLKMGEAENAQKLQTGKVRGRGRGRGTRRIFLLRRILQPICAVALGLAAGLAVTWAAGENPWRVFKILCAGAFGTRDDFGMTLFYTTPLIFTGLSVALAFHAGLFNIGAEGQLVMGALAVAALGACWPGCPGLLAPVLGVAVAFLAGSLWGAIPGWLRARRGSHEVINTIMLNFIAAGLSSYVIRYWLKNPDTQNPESRPIGEAYRLAKFPLFEHAPVGLALVLAVLAAAAVWFFLRRSVPGFELRAVGQSERAARAAGIDAGKTRIMAMTLAGGLAGLVGVAEVMGNAGMFKMEFSPGYGYMGIAVALLGRNQPLGIVAAALLFGALHKGTANLDMETDHVTRELSLILQALIILAVSAEGLWSRFRGRKDRRAPVIPNRYRAHGWVLI